MYEKINENRYESDMSGEIFQKVIATIDLLIDRVLLFKNLPLTISTYIV